MQHRHHKVTGFIGMVNGYIEDNQQEIKVMSEEQVREIHNQVIKGITLRFLGAAALVIVPIIYQTSLFINEQHQQGKYIEKMNTQLDTVQQRQSRYEFNNAVKFQKIDDKLQDLNDKK